MRRVCYGHGSALGDRHTGEGDEKSPDRRDIGQIALDEVILPGVVIDARGHAGLEGVDLEDAARSLDLAGKAVLLNFGWDQHWGSEDYYRAEEIFKKMCTIDPTRALQHRR